MNARMLVAVTALAVAGLIIPTGCGAGGYVPGTGTNAHESSPVQTEESKLPVSMPEAVQMRYHKDDGQVRNSTDISVKGDQLTYKEFTGPLGKDQNWTRKISADDREALYRAFVENKFDLIKNDPGVQANDTPSESIGITSDGDIHSWTDITWDQTVSPLSGVSQSRFQAIRQVFLDLTEKYRSKK